MPTIQYTETIEMTIVQCANCGMPFGISTDFQKRKMEDHSGFCCPNGHSNIYGGKTEAEKLRDELKRKEAEMAAVVEEKWNERARADQAERKLKRIHRGVCPCCNRTFQNLAKHMQTKHPEVIKPAK